MRPVGFETRTVLRGCSRFRAGWGLRTRDLSRRSARLLSVVFVALLVCAPLAPGVAEAREPVGASTQATLGAPTGSVTVVSDPTGAAHAGADGETLQEGDRIITGADGSALITFSDGSEV